MWWDWKACGFALSGIWVGDFEVTTMTTAEVICSDVVGKLEHHVQPSGGG